MTEILAFGTNNDDVCEQQIDRRILFEEFGDGLESSRQILFIAIEVSENFALGARKAAIDGIVHALVRFDERLDASILPQPIQGAIVRAGVLNDVFAVDGLVGDGGNAKLQPFPVAETGCDDGELHEDQAGQDRPGSWQTAGIGLPAPLFHEETPTALRTPGWNLNRLKTGLTWGTATGFTTPPLRQTLSPSKPVK